MKRIILFVILYFGIFPYLDNSGLHFVGSSKGFSQNTDYQLASYLSQQNGPNYTYQVINHNCGCAVMEVNLVTGEMQIIYATPQWIEQNLGFDEWRSNPNNSNPPEPPIDPEWAHYMENYISHLEDILRAEQRLQEFAQWASEFWNNIYAGLEAVYQEPIVCEYGESGWEASQENELPFTNFATAASLPCANKFLLASKRIVQFTPAQLARIARFNFDGSTLISVVDINGVTYTNALGAELAQADYKCSPDWQIVTEKLYVKKVYSTFKFIAFDRVQSHAGTPALPNAVYHSNLNVWEGIPFDNLDYCFEVPFANTQVAAAGNVVVGINSSGVLYCETLTAEDVKLTTLSGRDERFKLKSLHLHHYINVDEWLVDFLKKIAVDVGPCTINYVNQRLDELHADPVYVNETNENNKKLMEIKTATYSFIFGLLYCNTDEATAQGKAPAIQFGYGMLHEAIASIDIQQIVTGLAQIAKGAEQLVSNVTKNFINTVKQTIEQQLTQGSVDYTTIAKDFIKANTALAESVYNKIVSIANHFQETYFTKCNTDPVYGNICSYRHGQVTMMAVPIVLTAGEYAILKLGTLVSKYSVKTTRAVQLMDMAPAASRTTLQETYTVLDDAGVPSTPQKTVIKESNGTVHSTIKHQEDAGNKQVVVTEAADFINSNILTNLTSEIPTASGSLSKTKFHNSAHKIDPQADPAIKMVSDDIIANGDVTGVKTEALQNYLFDDKMGLTPLDGKYGSNNGFDGIFIEGTTSNPTKIVITESKQQWNAGVALAPENPVTQLPAQMSNNWINYVANRLEEAGKIQVANMVRNNPTLIEKYVIAVNKSTGDLNILKLGNF